LLLQSVAAVPQFETGVYLADECDKGDDEREHYRIEPIIQTIHVDVP